MYHDGLPPYTTSAELSLWLHLSHGALRTYKWECFVSGDVQNTTHAHAHAHALAAVTTVDNSAQLGQNSERVFCGGAVLERPALV